MADTATASLASILSGTDYVTVPGVPVFDEHEEYNDAGQLVRRFGRSELQEIADACNRRESQTGDLSPFGPGHTIDGAPEVDQPPIWGYNRNFRVEKFGPEGRLGLLCDFLVKRSVDLKGQIVEGLKAMAAFPRRSIEYWTKDKVIDWIALLRRTPQRDLGLLTYARDLRRMEWAPSDPLYYDALKKRHLAGHLSPAGKLRYAMETPMADTPGGAPTGVDPGFYKMFMQCMNSYFGGGGGGAAAPAPPQAVPERHQPGFPGGGNTMLPPSGVSRPNDAPDIPGASRHPPHPQAIPMGVPGGGTAGVTPVGTPPQMEHEKLRLMKEADMIRFQRMEAQVQELSQKALRAECESEIRQLLYEGVDLDVATELDAFVRLNPEQRKVRADYMRRYYRHDPAGGRMVTLAPDMAANPRETSRDERDAAVSYATKHKVDFDTALKATRTA